MSINIQKHSDGKVIEITIDGKLTESDYNQFIPLTEQLIQTFGKISLVIVLQEFGGWDMSALWDDLTFDYKHFSDIRRVAVVGDGAWDRIMSELSRPFTAGEVKFFNASELQAARQWADRATVG
ncbi:MAG: STAS/SEC14 domain-containing protein [Aureliella sp.]